MEGYDPAEAAQRSGIALYDQTVNLASRIADYAQAGEVIVSQEVVDASIDSPVAFRDVGPVELKGVSGARRLFAAAQK